MNVLSLCDGIACGRIALERADIKVDKYYASEINEPSIKVALDNYTDIIELGDIRNWDKWDIQWKDIDLLIGGTPCQDFSQLGKEKLNFDGERSGLFFEYVNILNHIRQFNPNVKFLLENVKMKSDWADLISSHLGVDYVYINSAGKYLRINLCGLYGSMSEQFLHSGNSHPLMNQQGGTGMTAHMVGYPFFDTTQSGQLSKLLIHFRVTRQSGKTSDIRITVKNAQCPAFKQQM